MRPMFFDALYNIIHDAAQENYTAYNCEYGPDDN